MLSAIADITEFFNLSVEIPGCLRPADISHYKLHIMVLFDYFLIVSGVAFIASFYYYYKERSALSQFMQLSRRHRYNESVETFIRQKAKKYLLLSLSFLFISVTLLILRFTTSGS
jgi:hypothetical protein